MFRRLWRSSSSAKPSYISDAQHRQEVEALSKLSTLVPIFPESRNVAFEAEIANLGEKEKTQILLRAVRKAIACERLLNREWERGFGNDKKVYGTTAEASGSNECHSQNAESCRCEPVSTDGESATCNGHRDDFNNSTQTITTNNVPSFMSRTELCQYRILALGDSMDLLKQRAANLEIILRDAGLTDGPSKDLLLSKDVHTATAITTTKGSTGTPDGDPAQGLSNDSQMNPRNDIMALKRDRIRLVGLLSLVSKEVESLQTRIKTRDREMEGLKRAIVSKENDLKTLHVANRAALEDQCQMAHEISQLRISVAAYSDEMEASQKERVRLGTLLSTMSEEVEFMTEKIGSQDDELFMLNRTLISKDDEIGRLCRTLVSKDDEIEGLYSANRENAPIVTFQDTAATSGDTEAMNKQLQAIRKQLECPVCYYVMQTSKTLPCGHTFCTNCLLYMDVSRDRTANLGARCPECRQTHASYSSGMKVFLIDGLASALAD